MGFNPSRLDLARRRRGLTKTELATRSGLSTSILRAYERVGRTPSPQTVATLAAALDFPPAFFERADVDGPTVDGVSFRSMSSMTARQRDQAIGAATLALELDDWIQARFVIPTANLPQLAGDQPEAAAEALRSAWGMGQRRAPNMVHLLEAHGVRVFSLAQESREVDAFSFWRHGIPYIFLNGLKTAERSRMDAAHELGHLVLHAHGVAKGRTAEDQAQDFGSAFLMPRRSLLAEAPRGGSAAQIIRAKPKWNVAAMNLAHRMARLGLLTEWQVRSAYIELARLGYRRGEPVGIGRETSQVLPKIFAALRAEGISRAHVADQLHVRTEEINQSVFGLVLARDDGPEPPASPTSLPTARGNLRLVDN